MGTNLKARKISQKRDEDEVEKLQRAYEHAKAKEERDTKQQWKKLTKDILKHRKTLLNKWKKDRRV